MTIQVNVGEAQARLAELLAQVDAGGHLVIAEDGEPRYEIRLIRHDRTAARKALEEIRADRLHGEITVDDILSWRDEGRR